MRSMLRPVMRGAVLAALLTAGATDIVAQGGGQGETPYAATRLIGRWRAIINSTLEDSRAFASEGVGELMEIFVSPGAVRLVQDKANDDTLRKVDAIVERYALAVVKAGARQPDGSVIVGEAAVDSAERAVCPVYPFCQN